MRERGYRRSGAQVVEERTLEPAIFDGGFPFGFREFGGQVNREGDQIECDEDCGQVVFCRGRNLFRDC